ncbi:futalosine hydrolase [Salsuginibacillus kocurii]|uniref:futalosine hydrolase n=1 Tax=Salsuginibacillus kocurii TaxID=427078 RepID=UPI0003638CF0|nr:futalosine hydrolase [Salsuginibacillus kocurii]
MLLPENNFDSSQEPLRSPKHIAILTAVDVEKEAVERGISQSQARTPLVSDAPSIDVAAVGVGPIEAAARASSFLAKTQGTYDLVISAGIGGGFRGRAPVGSVVLATEMVAADLGVETNGGFQPASELNLAQTRIPCETALASAWRKQLVATNVEAVLAPVLTLATVTGSKATADRLAAREPEAAAEAMEGYGVGTAANHYHIPVLEIRAISNTVGPRDRENWQIKEALEALEQAIQALQEVLTT